MTNAQLHALTGPEMERLAGGSWEWGDFLSGASWTIGAGCYYSGNPYLCGASLVIGAIALYA